MNGGVPKSRIRYSHSKLSNTSNLSTGPELPQSHGEQSPASGDLARDAPVSSTKRRRDATTESDPLPAKRARSTRTSTQPPGVEDGKAELAAKTTLQSKPKPPPKRLYAPSLEPKTEGPEQVSAATRLRKRQICSDGSDTEHQPKRARLTRGNLALFNKMGRKKETNKASASAPPESTVDSSTTKTTSTTTSGFAIQARKNGMLHPRLSKPPKNLEDIRKRHARSRATASPPESEYERYAKRVEGAPNETTMVFEVGSKLLKEYDDEGYTRVFNQAFTGFPKDVGFNNGLSAPQPDFAEGPEMEDYRPFPVDEHISGAVLYKDNPFSLTLPHLAGEWKGRGKDMEEARLQSSYDGAALVYGRSQALDCMGKPYLAGHAKVTTFTTDGTTLNLFSHYAAPSKDGELEYHQYPVSSTNLKNSFEEFKKGRRQLRNAQDDAREESYELRDQLKDYWKARKSQPVPLPAIEDEDDYEVIEQQPAQQPTFQPTPPTSSKPKHGKTSSSRSSHSTVPSPPPAMDFASGSGYKRKAPSSQSSRSSKKQDYWQVDEHTGRHFHAHRDGRVTWRD